MCVSGISFLFYLFSFLSLHQKHGILCFWCFFLFIFFLCTPGTCVCVFQWFIFIFAPWDAHYMCVCRGFFFFLIFCSSLHPSNPFRPADMHYEPQDTCFKPPATYNPNPHVSTIYNPQPRVHWHPRPRNAHTSNRTCISSLVYFFWLRKRMCKQSYMHF